MYYGEQIQIVLILKLAAHLRRLRSTLACVSYTVSDPVDLKISLQVDKDFNKMVSVNIVTIEGKTALHVVDEATRYESARWLPYMRAEDVGKAPRLSWIDVYLGPPDI